MSIQKGESLRTRKAGELFLDAARHVPADRADWKPHPDTSSAREITHHMSWANRFFAAKIRDEAIDPPTDPDPETPWEDVCADFGASCKALVEVVAKTPDDALDQTREMPWGQVWKVKALMMGASLHLAYHWGQIGYLQKAWGDTTDYHLQR